MKFKIKLLARFMQNILWYSHDFVKAFLSTYDNFCRTTIFASYGRTRTGNNECKLKTSMHIGGVGYYSLKHCSSASSLEGIQLRSVSRTTPEKGWER